MGRNGRAGGHLDDYSQKRPFRGWKTWELRLMTVRILEILARKHLAGSITVSLQRQWAEMERELEYRSKTRFV